MSRRYVTTNTVLDRILARTAEDLSARMQRHPLSGVIAGSAVAAPPRDMLAALHRPDVALIAEVKHASPSRGVLVDPFEPVTLGRIYAANGAAAISVLTDEPFFQSHLDYLSAVRRVVPVPVLRKDFIIDPYQVYEGRMAGADAILLIASALEDGHMADLHATITGLGMTALVEVHNEAELERALRLEPALLGINNRNLKTFEVRLETTARLAALVPAGVTLVAESGIFNGEDARQMGHMGARAILVGEALVTAGDIAAKVRELSSQPLE
ncbi:MAG: indole-3-glycerol phosphate synthase TrpC [Anaerolineae bacterium]|nr:indole-3-glycerol phosphate synthase TrpC [Anaerolineae bacterium]